MRLPEAALRELVAPNHKGVIIPMNKQGIDMRLSKEDQAYLADYDPAAYDRPSVAVDLVILSLQDEQLKVLLVQRGVPPFKGKWALPGGFLDKQRDASLDAAAARELREETGAQAPYLEQLYTFGDRKRDPRDWTVSVVYFALMPHTAVSAAVDSDATAARWWPVHGETVSTTLAFDHKTLLSTAIQRVRAKLEYTGIAVHLLPQAFTLSQLQRVYELVLDEHLEKKSFRRSLERAGIVEPTGGMTQGKGRPAQLYRFKADLGDNLFFPRSIVRAHQ